MEKRPPVQRPFKRCLILVNLLITNCCSFHNQHFPVPKKETHFLLRAAASDGRRKRKASADESRRFSAPDLSRYLATCVPGLSEVLSNELEDLGCVDLERVGRANSAVYFSADTTTALKVLLWTRTSHKVMEFLCSSGSAITDRQDLYDFIRARVPVKDLLGDGRGGLLSLSVQTMLNNPSKIPKDINHSHYTALTIKNALCDAIRDLRGDRPDVDLEDPDVPITAVLLGANDGSGAQVSLFRQIHTGSLHKRGYRQDGPIHKAALKESLAAGLVLKAGWKEQCETTRRQQSQFEETESQQLPIVLMDPMAGSGSLLLEAAMMAADLSPGLMRIKCGVSGQELPPILRWKHDDGDKSNVIQTWKELLLDATGRAKNGLQWLRSSDCSIKILANDIHPSALDLFENALNKAGLNGIVDIYEGDCQDWEPEIISVDSNINSTQIPWTVVTNPPWGARLTEDVDKSWEAMRVLLRQKAPPGSQAWILSGDPTLTKHLGMRRSQSVPLKTGQQDLRWLQYIIRERNENSERTKRKRGAEEPVSAIPATSPTAYASSLSTRINPEENEWLVD